MTELPMVLILAGLAAYAVLGGADFGAGLWELTARGRSGAERREHIHHALAPVWEANHVWLIFVLVVCWTAYPTAFASIASMLTVPLFIAAVGIILRGTSYALRSGEPSPRQEVALSVVFALSSILTPSALGAAAGAIASGRVPVGNAGGELLGSWINPTSVLVGLLAVGSAAYLAAVYLAGTPGAPTCPNWPGCSGLARCGRGSWWVRSRLRAPWFYGRTPARSTTACPVAAGWWPASSPE